MACKFVQLTTKKIYYISGNIRKNKGEENECEMINKNVGHLLVLSEDLNNFVQAFTPATKSNNY